MGTWTPPRSTVWTCVAGLVAGLLLALGPAGAADAKPTASVEFELPAEGRVGFSHFVLKAKKAKKVSRKAAKRIKRRSGKLGKKVRATARLRSQREIPADVAVAVRVARLEQGRNRYAADVAVLHAGPGARAARLRGGGSSGIPGIDLTLVRIPKGDGIPLQLDGTILRDTADPDVTANGPNRDGPCADFGLYGLKRFHARSSGDLIVGLPATRDAVDLAQHLFCDRPILPDRLNTIFDRLRLDQPPLCTPNLSAAPPPNADTEIVIRFFCRQSATSIGFEIPGRRTIQGFVAPSSLPNCQPFTNNLSGNKTLICGNGTLPANTVDSVQVRPSSPLRCDDKVRTYHNPLTNAFPPVQDTQAFATCP